MVDLGDAGDLEVEPWRCRDTWGACRWPVCGQETCEGQYKGDEGQQDRGHDPERDELVALAHVVLRPNLVHARADQTT